MLSTEKLMRLKYKSILILLYSCNMINKVKVNKPGSRTGRSISTGRGLKLSSWQLFTSCLPRQGFTHYNRLELEPRSSVQCCWPHQHQSPRSKFWNLRTAPEKYQRIYESIEPHRTTKISKTRTALHQTMKTPGTLS